MSTVQIIGVRSSISIQWSGMFNADLDGLVFDKRSEL